MAILHRKKDMLPAPQLGDERLSELQRTPSQSSVQSSTSHRALKTLFKGHRASKSPPADDPESLAEHTAALTVDLDAVPRKISKKRPVSTIVENNDDDEDDEFASDSDSQPLDDSSGSSDSEDSDYDEMHTHAVKKRAKGLDHKSQLSTLMGYCGLGTLNQASLTQAANEEAKRTFSLLDSELKIHRLLSTTKKDDPRLAVSVIGEKQVSQLDHIKNKLTTILQHKDDQKKQQEIFTGSRTLYDKYGTVSKVIGRGAYGLIKIIEAQDSNNKADITDDHRLYAVKELQKRPNTDSRVRETKEQFIERILSEFIISSTLNNRHIVKTVDLMYTLPPTENVKKYWAEVGEYSKISQIMECTPGGDLFTYVTTTTDIANKTISGDLIEESECFVKQIARGLWYMHQHGVAHCDLKLENILVTYQPAPKSSPSRSNVLLKLSDFGKSNVVQTKWDATEQPVPYSTGPIGSEPYIAPEEYGALCKKGSGYSAKKKDNWALGVLILTLFNIQKSLYSNAESPGASVVEHYGNGYVWHSTESRCSHLHKGDVKYKDKVFEKYIKQRMVADYDQTTKEWLIKRKGSFVPIETLFVNLSSDALDSEDDDDKEDEEEEEFSELRKMLLYSFLDPNPLSRLTVGAFLKSDWMKAVDTCT